MYADKDSRGLVSVLEMDRPEWTALAEAATMAVGVWRVQLKGFDGVRPCPELDTEVIQRIMYLKERISVCETFVSQMKAIEGKGSAQTFNPFDL